MENSLKEYIKNSWLQAVREKKDGELKLPYPFVPPCLQGDFLVLYYWDTYFTNVGLIADEKTEYAKYNVDNLLYALDCFGCVPNYTRDDGAKWCSQPPLLRLMVEDVYKATKDENWHQTALLMLEKEFVRTGKLWERYDENGVVKGLEYETQPMLGWTAGVYNYFWGQR